jgi:hypothetical protein
MTELRIGDQLIRFDRDATVLAYSQIPQGDADRCDCSGCRNFALQREKIYPDAFRALLNVLGIDHHKEGEAIHYGPKGALHFYGGWFHFVGVLLNLVSGWSISAMTFSISSGRVSHDLKLHLEKQSLPLTSQPYFHGFSKNRMILKRILRWLSPAKLWIGTETPSGLLQTRIGSRSFHRRASVPLRLPSPHASGSMKLWRLQHGY